MDNAEFVSRLKQLLRLAGYKIDSLDQEIQKPLNQRGVTHVLALKMHRWLPDADRFSGMIATSFSYVGTEPEEDDDDEFILKGGVR